MNQIILSFLLVMVFSVAELSQTTVGLKESKDNFRDFPSLKAFLKSNLKKKDTLIDQARGDLNGDGVADWVGIIKTPGEPFSHILKLFVLFGKGKSAYQVAFTSNDIPGGGMGCCWVDDLNIRNSSIYIQNVAKSVSDYERSTHQFKLYNGEWRLVGLKILYEDQTENTSKVTDFNLLTGKVVETDRKGKRKPTTKSYQKKFGEYFLKDFDFEVDFGNELVSEEPEN